VASTGVMSASSFINVRHLSRYLLLKSKENAHEKGQKSWLHGKEQVQSYSAGFVNLTMKDVSHTLSLDLSMLS
jgi:hypothetical protein